MYLQIELHKDACTGLKSGNSHRNWSFWDKKGNSAWLLQQKKSKKVTWTGAKSRFDSFSWICVVLMVLLDCYGMCLTFYTWLQETFESFLLFMLSVFLCLLCSARLRRWEQTLIWILLKTWVWVKANHVLDLRFVSSIGPGSRTKSGSGSRNKTKTANQQRATKHHEKHPWREKIDQWTLKRDYQEGPVSKR